MGKARRTRASVVENLSTRLGHAPDPLSTVWYCVGADASCGARARRLALPPRIVHRQNMVFIHGFQSPSNEGLERMFARLNLIARPLEKENPPTITTDRITTRHAQHLETILKADDFKELGRQIRDAQRTRAADGKRPLNRRYIHELALQQDRETLVQRSKLRAAGLIAPPIHDRTGDRLESVGRTARQQESVPLPAQRST